MSTTRWRVKAGALEEREEDFTGHFVALNVDTGKQVTITLQQMKRDPASDLVGACRALALLLEKASKGELDADGDTGVALLH
jgi:hypothetical protein